MKFSGLKDQSLSFILLINIRMPTIVVILTFMCISCSGELSMKKCFITSDPCLIPVQDMPVIKNGANSSLFDIQIYGVGLVAHVIIMH